MKIRLLTLSLFFTLITFAQPQTSIEWGPEYSIRKNVLNPETIGWADGRFFVVRNDYKKNHIESYNTNTLALENSLLIPVDQNNTELTYLSKFIFNDKPYFLFAGLDLEAKKLDYYLQSYSTDKLEPSELILIARRNYNGEKPRTFNGLQSLVSFYGSDVLLYQEGENLIVGLNLSTLNYTQSSLADTPQKEYSFFSINATDEVSKGSVFTNPPNNFRIEQTLIKNKNELIFLGCENTIEIQGGREVWKQEDIILIKANLETQKQIETKVELEDGKYIHSYIIHWLSSGQIVISGFTGAEGDVDGYFSQVYNDDLEVVSLNYDSFSPDFVKSTLSEKELKKYRLPVLSNYFLTEVLVDDLGNYFVIAEEFNFDISTVGDSDFHKYMFGNLLIMKYDKNGVLSWKKIVQKNQITTNDRGRYSSYFAYTKGGNLNLIFNEREGQMVENYEEGMSEKKWGKVFGNMVTIDAVGATKKQKVFEFSEKNLMHILPNSCEQIDENTLLLYARNKRSSMIGKMKI